MKKTLLSLFAAALCLTASAAETKLVMAEVDLFANATKNLEISTWDQDGFGFKAEKNGGATTPAYNINGKDVRLYAKNTLEITSSTPMTSITFEISAQGKKRLCEVTASTGEVGEIKNQADNVVWTGNATSVIFTVDPNDKKAQFGSDGDSKPGQFDFLSLTIVTDGVETSVAEPVFTPAPGTYYTPQTVTIATRTGGAQIYFQLDGMNDFALYEGNDIEVEESTTIKAYAVKGELKSETVTAEYVIADMPAYNSLAEVLDMAKDLANKEYSQPFIVNFEPVVTYVNGSNTYLAENGKYCLLYKKDLGIEAGYKVAKGWQAKIQNFNGILELVPDASSTVVAGDAATIPAPVYIQSAEDLNESVISAVVYVANVTFAEATTAEKKSFTASLAGTDVTFYNAYSLASVAAGTYDVRATIGSYNALQIQPIEYLTAGRIEAAGANEAPVEYFNLQGIRVDAPAAGSIVIRRQGNEVSKIFVR